MPTKKQETGAGPLIVWFRDDLRLADNPILHAAVATGRPLVCVFNHDDKSADIRPLGGAARWWLHGSLEALDNALRARAGRLLIVVGPATETIPRLAAACGAEAVYFNHRYGAPERRIDESVSAKLGQDGVNVKRFNGNLLNEPWQVRSRSGEPFRAFSPFLRAANALGAPADPLPAPVDIRFHDVAVEGVDLADLALEPSSPDWAGGLREAWTRGETGAMSSLEHFLENGLHVYAGERDRPDSSATSRLSPYLRFGNISVRQIWHAAVNATPAGRQDRNIEKFLSELGWREFSYHLLYHNPDLGQRNLQPRFDRMPWRHDPPALRAWKTGLTGYPLVDAGMRELWTTGWMHNRVRMVAASFLTKHLLIDWREGEAWFWDTLVDADPANNAVSWQWVAGSGADAAPFFRIFNPFLQAEKFNSDGAYIGRWLPELSELPPSKVHRRPETKSTDLFSGHRLADPIYPLPIVPHDDARRRALAAFKSLG